MCSFLRKIGTVPGGPRSACGWSSSNVACASSASVSVCASIGGGGVAMRPCGCWLSIGIQSRVSPPCVVVVLTIVRRLCRWRNQSLISRLALGCVSDIDVLLFALGSDARKEQGWSSHPQACSLLNRRIPCCEREPMLPPIQRRYV